MVLFDRESQQLFRIINEFSIAFAADSSGATAEEICFIAYAVLMLHTDRHNSRVSHLVSINLFNHLVPNQHPIEYIQLSIDPIEY